MVTIIAVYLFALEVITMHTTPRKFLVLHHTNGKLQFKTACLGPDQCHRGRLEISVVSSNPDMLTRHVRDVIIGYRDDLSETTYYMQTDPLRNHHITTTTEQNNATIFQMIIYEVQKEYQVTFVDISSNKTMTTTPQHDSKGNEVECGVGDLRLHNTTQTNKHGKHKPNFVLYDHVHKRYFNNNPECCL